MESLLSLYKRETLRKVILLSIGLWISVLICIVIVQFQLSRNQLNRINSHFLSILKPYIVEGNSFEAQRMMLHFVENTSLIGINVINERGENIFFGGQTSQIVSKKTNSSENLDIFNVFRTEIVTSFKFPLFEGSDGVYTVIYVLKNTRNLNHLLLILFGVSFVLLCMFTIWYSLSKVFFKKIVSPLIGLEHALKYYMEHGVFHRDEDISKILEYQVLFKTLEDLGTQVRTKENLLQVKSYDEVLGKISSQVIHDLRSPLTVLKMALGDGVPCSEGVNIARRAVDALDDMANDLLCRRKEALVFESKKEEVKLEHFVSDLENRWRYILDSNEKIRFRIELLLDASRVISVSTSDLNRALDNLIGNSVESILGRGEVKLKIFGSYEYVFIIVSDDGSGIPPNIQEQILKGVYGTTSKELGNGMGVQQVYSFVENNSGEISFKSSDLGTTFTIKFKQELFLKRTASSSPAEVIDIPTA